MGNYSELRRVLNNIDDAQTILKRENMLSKPIAQVILVFGAIFNFAIFKYVLRVPDYDVILNTIVLLSVAILFEIANRTISNESIKSDAYNIILSLVLAFSIARFYWLIGPAIWNVSIILIMYAMVKQKQHMIYMVIVTTVLMNIYVWIMADTYVVGVAYFRAQMMSYLMMLFVIYSVNKIISDRYIKIYNQYKLIRLTQNELEMTNSALEEEIEEHLRTVTALKTSEITFKTIFNGSSDSILIMKDNQYIDCNQATLEVLGYESKSDIIGKHPWDISPLKQPNGILSREGIDYILSSIKKQKKMQFEWWHEKADKELLPLEIMLTPIVLDGESVVHILWRDISKRKRFENDLIYLSYHDQLTGLYNRRFFDEELSRLDTSRDLPLTIIMADVNNLKLINDSLGHSKGDELLVKVAEAFKKGCRADDIIARIGGDEFVLLLPKTEHEEAGLLIERLNAYLGEEVVGFMNIGVSFGADTKVTDTEDVIDIMKRAEDFMYTNKIVSRTKIKYKMVYDILEKFYDKYQWAGPHSKRVSKLCSDIGRELGFEGDDIEVLENLGLLHDIGKIAIDDTVLISDNYLDENYIREYERHPEIGYRIIKTASELSEIAGYVLAHHEQWDGNGYPNGLRGEEIPLPARIAYIAESYEDRMFNRAGMELATEEKIITEFKSNAGIKFDPIITRVFIENVLGYKWE